MWIRSANSLNEPQGLFQRMTSNILLHKGAGRHHFESLLTRKLQTRERQFASESMPFQVGGHVRVKKDHSVGLSAVGQYRGLSVLRHLKPAFGLVVDNLSIHFGAHRPRGRIARWK